MWNDFGPEVITYSKKYKRDVPKYIDKGCAKQVQKGVGLELTGIRTNGTKRGYGIREPFPSCILEEVNKLFLDHDEEYVGFCKAQGYN